MYVKIQREGSVAIPWQQWLRERATILRVTYVACLVLFNFLVIFVLKSVRHSSYTHYGI
jgi:hypothetical protein